MNRPGKLGSLLALAGMASVAFAAATRSTADDGSGGCPTADGRLASTPPVPAALSGRAMGTTWAVKWIQPAVPLDPAAVERRIAARLEELDQQFSTYRPDSVVSRFNRSRRTDWLAVTPEVARVAQHAREFSALTDGAFDVTVAPLLTLWGFGPQRSRDTWPSNSEIAASCARVNWRRLEARLDPPALRKLDPQLSADFSSLAKGFAVDALSHRLAALGAANHLVQIGGDLKTRGGGGDGRGWRTAIEQPVENARSLARVITLSGQALSTSGDYRNFVTLGGRRAGHIVDPRSGAPAASALASVSVVHDCCAASSALATGLFVLGPDEGYRVAVQAHLACLFIVRDGAALLQRTTPEFEAKCGSLPREDVP